MSAQIIWNEDLVQLRQIMKIPGQPVHVWWTVRRVLNTNDRVPPPTDGPWLYVAVEYGDAAYPAKLIPDGENASPMAGEPDEWVPPVLHKLLTNPEGMIFGASNVPGFDPEQRVYRPAEAPQFLITTKELTGAEVQAHHL